MPSVARVVMLAIVLATLMAAAGLPGPVAPSALAHPPAIVSGEAEKAMAEELADFRSRLARAIAAKDAKALGGMYVDSFRHTRQDGTVEGKQARIATVLAGGQVIETAAAADLVISVPNGWAAIATGRSAIRARGDAGSQQLRWTAAYVRIGEGWQLAASQETRLARVGHR